MHHESGLFVPELFVRYVTEQTPGCTIAHRGRGRRRCREAGQRWISTWRWQVEALNEETSPIEALTIPAIIELDKPRSSWATRRAEHGWRGACGD